MKVKDGIAKDIERLKTANDEIQRMKEELAYFKRIHQEEMKEKCEKELNHLRSKTNFQNEFDAWIFYCKKTFNYENLKVEYYEDIDKFSSELQFKIQKMSEHEEAFLALAKDKCFAEDLIERFKDELQYQNICIFKNTLRNFSCNAIWTILYGILGTSTWNFMMARVNQEHTPVLKLTNAMNIQFDHCTISGSNRATTVMASIMAILMMKTRFALTRNLM